MKASALETFNIRKKLSVLQYTNIDTVEIFHALQNKVALLTTRCSERGTRNHQQKANNFWEALDLIYTKL